MEETNYGQQTPVQQQSFEQQPVQPMQQSFEQPVPPVYGAVPPATGADGGKKKGKGAVIAVIAVVIVLLLTVCAVLAYKMFGMNPKAKLVKGMTNFAEEMSDYGNPLAEEIDLDTILKKLFTEAYSVGFKLNMSVPGAEGSIDTVGFDMTTNYDYPNKLMDAQMAVSVTNIDILTMKMAAEENTLYVSLPNYLQNCYFVNTDTLGKDYNASPWTWMLDYSLDESLSFELFQEIEENEDVEFKLEEELKQITETMLVEDSGNAVEIERDGKTVKCDGVKVTFDKDALNDFMDALSKEVQSSEYMETLIQNMTEQYAGYMEAEEVEEMINEEVLAVFSVRFKSDVELCIYMDNKNRIVNIATPSKIKLEESPVKSVGFSLVFSGSERTLDEVSGTIKLESDENEVTAKLKRTAVIDKDTYENEFELKLSSGEESETLQYSCEWMLEEKEFKMSVSVGGNDDSTLSVNLEGGYRDVKQGESVTMEIGNLSVLENEEELLSMSGELSVVQFEGEIEIPTDAVDLFGMSEDEFYGMMEEFQTALYGLLMGF